MSLLNLSRKVLFSFFPDAKALFGWTMPDPTALRPLRWRPSSGPCRGFWPCASAEYLPKRHHVSRDTTDAHSSYCIKLHQIVSNCREQHESTWIKKRLWHLLCWGLGHVLMEYWKGACHAVNHAMDVCFSLWIISPLMWPSPHPIIDNSHSVTTCYDIKGLLFRHFVLLPACQCFY